jgi:peptidyl-prolyl cis-trans isomerase B (cyclophilin B)
MTLRNIALLTAAAVLFAGCTKKACDTMDKPRDGTKAVLETSLGKIVFEFLPNVAPQTVTNFKKLANQCFYNGTTFHRVIPGFMIQGGDPNSKSPDRSTHGMGGPGYTIKAEFNPEPHTRGAVSMARSSDPDSAGSQFFIVVADARYLDRQYTVFGRVTEGMEVADKIVAAPKDRNDNPVERIEMKRVYLGN